MVAHSIETRLYPLDHARKPKNKILFKGLDFTKGYIDGRNPQNTRDFYDISYFSGGKVGQGIQYPPQGEYLNPESEYQFKFQDLLSWIEKYVKEGKILDVGCGPSHLSYWVQRQEKPYQIFGCDISLSLLSSVHNQNKSRTVVSNTHELPFTSNTFQGVLFSDVLEHVWPNQAVKAVDEAYRIISPEGYLFVNIPNRDTWSDAAQQDEGHVWLPSIDEVIRLLMVGGFECNSIRTFTRGFPGSKLYRKAAGEDLMLPRFGRSIFACAQKQ